MTKTNFDYMAMALHAEEQSLHPTHKVGALICGHDQFNGFYANAHSNFWPPILADKIGRDAKLGNASTTVHAEIAAILNAPATENADIYVTDLPCPNCAKAIVEARIRNVYIDSHTHNTPLGLKIKPFFDDISLPVFMAAGVNVYELNSTTKTSTALFESKTSTLRPIQRPVHHIPLEQVQVNQEHFSALIKEQSKKHPFAACYAKTMLGQYTFLCVYVHRSIGLSAEMEEKIHLAHNKYEPTIQPLNRLILTCARHGMKIDPAYLYTSQVPTSREFVNLIGAGYSSLHIGNCNKSRDQWGLKALEQIREHHIIEIIS